MKRDRLATDIRGVSAFWVLYHLSGIEDDFAIKPRSYRLYFQFA